MSGMCNDPPRSKIVSRSWALGLQFVLLSSLLLGTAVPTVDAGEGPTTPVSVAQEIDTLLERDWKSAGQRPADPATDAEFLRRVTLDLVGRIPTVAETRRFLVDQHPAKREALINDLMQSRGREWHSARVWRRIWMPRSEAPDFRRRAQSFDQWLSTEFAKGQRYDAIVRSLITASPTPAVAATDPTSADSASHKVTPALFLATSDFEPEQLAANSMRAFLGLNLDCAQCHDHPFSRWKQDQFWETAAFFARPSATEKGLADYTLTITGTDRQVAPRLLTGAPPQWPTVVDHQTGRRLLADWLTASDNSFFAKNAVNRYWASQFGQGLIEPLDDLSQPESALHPEVLQVLSDAFIASGFDVQFLAAVVVRTRWYQSTSRTNADRAVPLPMRVLTGEQLYDSLQVTAGMPPDRFDLEHSEKNWNRREAFVALFPNSESGDTERSRKQVLAMMNGAVTEGVTNPEASPLLVGLQAPFLDDTSRIEALFLAAYSRFPTENELKSCGDFLAASQHPERLSQLFWALLNSTEFNTNH